jgi:hypothetical protein
MSFNGRDRAVCYPPVTRLLVGTAALLIVVAAPAAGQETAGRIKTASGAAFIVRQGVERAASPGQPVLQSDALKTGADGRLAVTLKDETRLSLGPNSDVRLEKFVYAPAESRLGFTLSIARGLLAYVSGRIARLSPDSVRLETPSAIIGVRGTRLVVQVD